MTSLWDSPVGVWKAALSNYQAALESVSAQLTELDFQVEQLSNSVETRTPPHITGAEYSRIVRWKLHRGRSRPRLQAWADGQDDAVVIATSTDAFAHLRSGDSRAALRALTALRGCGPATASAVLALAGAPFCSDELLEAVLGKRAYTENAFLRLSDAVREKADALGWVARDIEKAVYAAGRLGVPKPGHGVKGTNKRAREEKQLSPGETKSTRHSTVKPKVESTSAAKAVPTRRSSRLRSKTS